MKHLIIILSILLVGISSCNKIEEDLIQNDNVVFEQLNEQLRSATQVLPNQKQTTTSNLPQVGDDIHFSFKKPGGGTNIFFTGSVLSIQSNSSVFGIKASSGVQTIYLVASKNQININVPSCATNAPDYVFSSYKAALYVTGNLGLTGHYDWNSNGGCAYPGIYDAGNPSCSGGNPTSCPFTDPKIVGFHMDTKIVLYINW